MQRKSPLCHRPPPSCSVENVRPRGTNSSTMLDFPLAQKPTVHVYIWWAPVLFPWFHPREEEAKEHANSN